MKLKNKFKASRKLSLLSPSLPDFLLGIIPPKIPEC